MIEVQIWATSTSLRTVKMEEGTNPHSEARKLFGPFATVNSVRPVPAPRPIEHFSADYIREMSKGG